MLVPWFLSQETTRGVYKYLGEKQNVQIKDNDIRVLAREFTFKDVGLFTPGPDSFIKGNFSFNIYNFWVRPLGDRWYKAESSTMKTFLPVPWSMVKRQCPGLEWKEIDYTWAEYISSSPGFYNFHYQSPLMELPED